MINKILKNYIDTRPEDIFINYNNNNITYDDIAYAVEGRIKSMQAINIKKGELVGLYFNNSLDLVEVLFSCIELQVIPLIIPNNFTSNEFDNLNKNIKFDYLITNWDKLDNLKNVFVSLNKFSYYCNDNNYNCLNLSANRHHFIKKIVDNWDLNINETDK